MSLEVSWFEASWELSEERIEDIWENIKLQGIYDKYYNTESVIVSETLDQCCSTWTYIDIKFLLSLIFAVFLLIYLYVLLILFCFYRYKKEKHPFKHAFKKSRLWGTVISILVFCFIFLVGFV